MSKELDGDKMAVKGKKKKIDWDERMLKILDAPPDIIQACQMWSDTNDRIRQLYEAAQHEVRSSAEYIDLHEKNQKAWDVYWDLRNSLLYGILP
jgi:hypothetical protein